MEFFTALLLLLTLHRAHGCPSDCACSGTTVNCTGRGLTSIPSGIPPSTVVLLLNRNQISSISTTLLDHLDSLKTLDLSDNALTSLEEAQFAFQNDAVLEDIRLDYNQISFSFSAGPEPFLHLENSLKRLSISHNSFSNTLKTYHFKYHTKLEYLDLSYNSITRINSNSFPPSLVTLNIAYNSISLWSRSLYSPVQLKSLDMRGIAMSSLTLPHLQRLSSLETLKISGSRLATVSSSLLNGLTALKNMELSNSLISSLPLNFFAGSPSLEVVSLANNAFAGFENSVSANKLQQLILDGNKLTDYSFMDSFSGSANTLKKLSLKSNNISRSPSKIVTLLSRVENLDLSANSISQITDMSSNSLVSINLSNNTILSINPSVFENCSALTGINISGNSVEEISFDGLASRSAPLQWDVARNPWNCDCSLLKTYTTLRQNPSFTLKCGNSDAEHCFVCSTPANLNGQSIFSVYTELESTCAETTIPAVTPGNTTNGPIIGESSGSNSGAIIGAVVAVTVLLVVAIVVLILLKKRGIIKTGSKRGSSIVPIANADGSTYCELDGADSSNYEQISPSSYEYGTIADGPYSYAKNNDKPVYAMAGHVPPPSKNLAPDQKTINRLSAVEVYILPETTPKPTAVKPTAPPREENTIDNPYLSPIPNKMNQPPLAPCYMELDSRAPPNAYEL